MRNRIFTNAPSEEFAGYAKAVIDGPWVHVSGTTGTDPASGQMPADAAAQARNALATIGTTLAEAGASLADAVTTRVYLTDAADLRAVASVFGETFRDIRPTSTLLVCQIPVPGARVEIELMASRHGRT